MRNVVLSVQIPFLYAGIPKIWQDQKNEHDGTIRWSFTVRPDIM